jgi:hypothetical protein
MKLQFFVQTSQYTLPVDCFSRPKWTDLTRQCHTRWLSASEGTTPLLQPKGDAGQNRTGEGPKRQFVAEKPVCLTAARKCEADQGLRGRVMRAQGRTRQKKAAEAVSVTRLKTRLTYYDSACVHLVELSENDSTISSRNTAVSQLASATSIMRPSQDENRRT